jgi:ubiquinone/menaquinone biosynthesis C-methylase UbiE
MLEHAQKLTAQKKLSNCSWHHNDVLKFMQSIPAASYSVVYSRLAFHHMIDPFRVLLEMKRVCVCSSSSHCSFFRVLH